MKTSVLQKKIVWWFATLSVAVLLCLSAFYMVSVRKVAQTSENYVTQVSSNILTTLQNTFLNLEHCAVTLSSSDEVQAMFAQDNLLDYHTYAQEVQQVLDASYQPDELVENILIFDTDSHYYRLRGELGNTSCTRVGYLITQSDEKNYSVELTGVQYVGYVVDILGEDGQAQGYIVFLIRSAALEQLFYAYTDQDAAHISFVAKGEVLVSTNAALCGQSAQVLAEQSNVYLTAQVGYTPFEIIITDQPKAVQQVRYTFIITLCLVGGLLTLILLLFYLQLNKYFFRPVLRVIDNLQDMGAGRNVLHLQNTNEPQDFAQLVGEINEMISRLDQNAKEMLRLQRTTQMAEIEKQRLDIELLKKQINVHFLINTLSVIKRLSERGDSQDASALCIGLAQLLRYANSAEPYIQAVEEFHMMEEYLNVMRLRQAHAFTWEFVIDERVDTLMMPRMLIQPLVENAITHGLEANGGGHITLRAKVYETSLCVQVCDNGRGVPPQQLHAMQHALQHAADTSDVPDGLQHISLGNIQKRVRYFCGEGYGLQISSVQGAGTIATLTLPLIYDE